MKKCVQFNHNFPRKIYNFPRKIYVAQKFVATAMKISGYHHPIINEFAN